MVLTKGEKWMRDFLGKNIDTIVHLFQVARYHQNYGQ